MRLSIAVLAFLPLPLFAETLTIPSRATEATLYPQGGTVTHEVALTLTAGSHQIILPDLPPGISVDSLRIAGPDIKIGAVRYREDFTPPRETPETEVIQTARAQIKQLENQIQWVRDDAERQTLVAQAAQDRIDFLSQLGSNQGLPNTPTDLVAIADMVSTETLTARTAMLDARIAARTTLEQLDLLETALKKAQQTLDSLLIEPEIRPLLAIDVFAGADVKNVPLRVSYVSNALAWQPTYDVRLNADDVPELRIERSAQIFQGTGENWTDIRLILSTQAPNNRIAPSKLWPDLRRLFDPAELKRNRAVDRALESPVMMEPRMATMAAEADFATTQIGQTGLAITYTFSNLVNVASGADAVRIPFDTLTFPVDLVARAVPMLDDRAYLVAKFTNTSSEPLLPANKALRFFDGGLVGQSAFTEIAAGAETEIGFGAIDGLQLTRTILARAESDRGLITRSNEQTEDIRITIDNLTNRTWDIELRDRVPFSEQEDLEITYTARPNPTIRSVNNQRGILEWQFEMQPDTSKTVETGFKMTWPEGQQVR